VIIHNEHYEKLLRRIEWLQSANSTLIKENAALRRLAAHRAAVIEHQMITTSAHQITRFDDEAESIWDERVQRFMDADRAIINAARPKEGGAT
jgi:NAD-dependent DNA ligase